MPFDASPQACKSRCTVCPAARHCLIRGAVRADVERWGAGVESQVALPMAGKTLLESGAPVEAIFSVRAGCLKSFTVDEDGNERVRGFHLPGDFVGLDALGAASHPATVVAVTPAQVCRIPLAHVRRVMAESPALAQRLMENMSAELAQALALAGDYTAEQRLAAFLLSMEQRLGAGDHEVRLPMTRRDIANYLRLATETVCRVLTRFENQGQIRSANKTVRLVDGRGLRALAQPVNLALAHAA